MGDEARRAPSIDRHTDLDLSDAFPDAPIESNPRTGYRRGVTVNVLNPEVALFFLAFLPQFVESGASAGATPAVEMFALGGTYAVLTALYLGTAGLLSGGVRSVLRARPRLAGGPRRASGSVLVGLGAALAFEAGKAKIARRRSDGYIFTFTARTKPFIP